MNQDNLKQRAKAFVDTLSLPISKFAANAGFDRSAWYRWQKGENVFSDERLKRIDEYIARFGF